MKKMLIIGALAAFPAPAFAQDMTFEQVDKDSNKMVSSEEFMAAMPNMKEADFTTADADKSGDISADEMKMMMEKK